LVLGFGSRKRNGERHSDGERRCKGGKEGKAASGHSYLFGIARR
jgi:hypothetical protein